jgi:hypothetical protein
MKHLSLSLLIVCLILLNGYITSTELESLNYDTTPENKSSDNKKSKTSLQDALKSLDKFMKPLLKKSKSSKSSKTKERTSKKVNGVNKKSGKSKKSTQEKPKREVKVVRVTDPKVVSRNVHWLSVRLISKLLIKLGDRRQIDEIQGALIKNCPDQNVIPKIRDEVINFEVVVATVGKEKGVKAAVSVENWKNVIEAITKACPAVVEKSEGYKWIAKAKANLLKDQIGKFEKIQTKAELAIHRMGVFLRVTEKVIEKKIMEIKEALRQQQEAAKAKRLAIIRARQAEAERRRKAKLAEKKKREEEARKKKLKNKKKNGTSTKQKVKVSTNSTQVSNSTVSTSTSAPAPAKASFLELFTQFFRTETENKSQTLTEATPKKNKSNKMKNNSTKTVSKSSRKKSSPKKKFKKSQVAPKSTNTTTNSSETQPEPLYVNVVRTPVNRDVAWNTPEQDAFVKKTGINKMKNMTLSTLIARTLKFFAKII